MNLYARPHMINIPRALLEGRTGREPLDHRNRAAAGVGAFHGDDHYVGMDFVDPPVDFAGVAKSLGMEAIRITDPDQLKSTLSSSFSRPGAKLIEVMVNNAVN
jgi:TPP-dependent trihydroxycyclohexane-1,2-dione (THcHDO) dehydratase